MENVIKGKIQNHLNILNSANILLQRLFKVQEEL